MIPDVIRKHLDGMEPYSTLTVAKARDSAALINSAKEYIDEGHPELEFNHEYTMIKKLHPWPPTTTP